MNVETSLVCIPGHCGIPQHDLAYQTAGKAIKAAADIPTSELSFDTCKKMIDKQCKASWQTRWNRATVGILSHV